MPITIGNTMLKKLVAEQSGVDVHTVEKVFEAREKVIKDRLELGSKVYADGLGHFTMAQTKPTRRRSPHNGAMVDVPSRSKVVFKEVRKTKNDDTL